MKTKVYTLKDAGKILGLSPKTLYARLKNEKYKNCFVIIKDAPKQFLYYKAECIEEELKNRVNENDKAKLIDLFYEIIDLLEENNIDETYLKEKAKEYYKDKNNIKYVVSKFLECNPVTKNELEEFMQILNSIKKEL